MIPASTINWEQLFDELRELDAWLVGLGIDVTRRNDRLHRAVEIFEQARKKGDLAEPHRDLRAKWGPDVYLILSELLELNDILQSLRNEPAEILAPKVKAMLKGTLSPRNETLENNQARNAAFELALAAEWRLGGRKVRLCEPDIKVWFDGVPFLVACKRPFSERGVKENVTRAAGQIRNQLNKAKKPNQWGIIAICVSRILSKGTMIFRAQAKKDLEILGDNVQELLDRQWPRWARTTFDNRIKAVIFHCSTPAIIESLGLWSRVVYSVYRELGGTGPVFQHIRLGLESI